MNSVRKIFATRDQLYQWYVIQLKSYRWIMKELNCNSARSIKRLLVENGIEIRNRSQAVKTQWIKADQRRKQTSTRARENLRPYWGTQSKIPEVAAKISASKIGYKNPMYGISGAAHHNWLGGKQNWRFKRKIMPNRKKKLIQDLGGKCEKCGAESKLTIHHNPPWRIIRSHDLKYLHVLCETCHFHSPIDER
jgi:hypothetical protein